MMDRIPNQCPRCGSYEKWLEVIDPNTSGIPLSLYLPFSFAKHIRLRLGAVRGVFRRPLRHALGRDQVQYRCHSCGFRGTYALEE